MNGGNGKMVELLERIALGVEETNKRLDTHIVETQAGFAGVNARLDKHIAETQAGFAAVNIRLDKHIVETNAGFIGVHARQDAANKRLDNVIEFFGRYFNDHEQRLRALEQHVFAKSGT